MATFPIMRWLTVTHTQRWHAHHETQGTGPLYQGRFKSFPIAEDEHLLTVIRYVERNPLRAGRVTRAERWPWSSLCKRRLKEPPRWLLPPGQWPVACRDGWLPWVNSPQSPRELEAMRECLRRGRPFGNDDWVHRTVKALGMQSTLRPRGRPKKRAEP